jgi:phosphoribosylformimino-5-aminoimidazole carboxamide ribotide isomerase
VILFPAIDLKDGLCVRLEQGDMARATVFNRDPAAQARDFQDQGFDYLHVVDLNGAFVGKPVNAQAVEAMLKTVTMPVQLGGGIRDMATLEAWLDKGITRVIIGTAAVRDPAFVKEAAKKYPGRVAVGLDARERLVAVQGWAEKSTLTVFEMADRFQDAGVAAIIYTDIDRDGVLKGVNWNATYELADHTEIPVIASGGLSDVNELRAASLRGHPNVEGVISGRALYDGRIDPAEAIAVLKNTKPVVARYFRPGHDELA